MKISCRLSAVVVSAAMLHVGGGQAVGQVELGGGASVTNIRGGTFALGGRLGIPLRQSFRMGIRLEGGVDYYWPPCTSVECDAVGTHLDLIFQNRIGGQALGYFGLGATFQSYTLQDDDLTVAEGDSWGFDLVAGSRYSSQTALRPFGEIRWTAMDKINNQWAVVFGALVPLGR